jgi:N-acetylgalactosamine kinase
VPYTLGQWRHHLSAADSGEAGDPQFRVYLEDNYAVADRPQVLERYARLTEIFATRVGSGRLRVARAPGRINLIGEHTDYNGLPVLPMAIDRDIAALFVPRPDRSVEVTNTDPSFPPRSFATEGEIPPSPPGDWANYCKAAVQGVVGELGRRGVDPGRLRGFHAVVDGNIPSAAGMSSSSALVVLCAMMFLGANGLDMPCLELAELLAEAEKYVGTQGGGMDQAISLMGQPESALRIDFFPLETAPVRLPDGCRFVVANSLVRADKGAGAQDLYNRRPIECRLTVAVLRRAFERRLRREVPLLRLGDLRPDRLDVPKAEIEAVIASALNTQPYTLSQVAAALGANAEQTARTYCRRRDGSIFPQPPDGFKLHARFRHVTEEGRRVADGFAALREGDVALFGTLMNASHASCRDLYEISCPELDRLVDIARGHGALGSRLTGAGFGGCAVCLVKDGDLPRFLAGLREEYYRGFLGRPEEPLGDILFPCCAVAGAQVLPPHAGRPVLSR